MVVDFKKSLKVFLGSVLSAALFKALLTYLKFLKVNRFLRTLPYPSATPIGELRGSEPEIIKNLGRLYTYREDRYTEAERKTGKQVDTLIYPSPIYNPGVSISTRDPVIIRHILKDKFPVWNKSERVQKDLGDVIGQGIFASSHSPHSPDKGAIWNLQRKTASKMFTRNLFNGHVYTTIIKNTETVLAKMKNHVKTSPSRPFEVKSQLYCFAMDSIGEIGYGVDLNTLKLDELPPFSKAFDGALQHFMGRQYRPYWSHLKWFYAAEIELTQQVKILDDFANRIIRDRRQENYENMGDILSMFVQADPNATDKFLRDVILSFFLAGRDTTSATLSFAFYLLGEDSRVQEKLYEEIRNTFGKYNNPEKLTLDMLHDMPYLDAVIFEVLRLYPPVPLLTKQAEIDDILPDGTFMPRGSTIVYEPFVMNRNGRTYKEPNKFLPERWLNKEDGSPRDVQTFDSIEFPIFQAGKRNCIGKDLALFESKLFIVEVMRQFKWKYLASTKKEVNEFGERIMYLGGATISFKHDLNIQLSERL